MQIGASVAMQLPKVPIKYLLMCKIFHANVKVVHSINYNLKLGTFSIENFACLYRRNDRFYAPTDVAIRFDTLKTVNLRIFKALGFFVAKNYGIF